MRQSRSFKHPQQRGIYELYSQPGRDPLRPGGDGLSSAFHRGFLYPDKSFYERTSLAYAAFAAGRDVYRDCKKAIQAAGIVTTWNDNGGCYWYTPGYNVDDPGYREAEFPMTSEAAAIWDAFKHIDAVIGAGRLPENPEQQSRWAIERLRESLKPGAIIYTVRRHMSRTNHRHEVSLFATRIDIPAGFPVDEPRAVIDDITNMAALALFETRGPHGGIDTPNVGADTGAQLVARLSTSLWPDHRPHGDGTKALSHERL